MHHILLTLDRDYISCYFICCYCYSSCVYLYGVHWGILPNLCSNDTSDDRQTRKVERCVMHASASLSFSLPPSFSLLLLNFQCPLGTSLYKLPISPKPLHGGGSWWSWLFSLETQRHATNHHDTGTRKCILPRHHSDQRSRLKLKTGLIRVQVINCGYARTFSSTDLIVDEEGDAVTLVSLVSAMAITCQVSTFSGWLKCYVLCCL